MKKISYGLIAISLLLYSVMPATAGVSIGIGLPNVSIGINLPLFPELVPVPGYPVYYAPQLDANYFFYDGMYWVYQNDNWYASSWYNGPWGIVGPNVVPLYILRIPVRYYRQPPVYFRGWQSNAPPRWGQHWGRGWEQNRRGWDRWNRSSAPAPAPLPVYQRQYSGDTYPHVEQQRALRSQSYRYQPRDKVVREHFKQQEERRAPAPAQRGRQEAPPARSPSQNQQNQQVEQRQQREQRQQVEQRQQHEQGQQPRSAQPQPQPQPQRPRAAQPQPQPQPQQPRAIQPQREQQAPKAQEREQRQQDRGASQEPNQGRGQGQNRDDDRGRGRDK